MRRGAVKREKSKKINSMNKEELTNLLKKLEIEKQKESKIYAEAVKQLSQK